MEYEKLGLPNGWYVVGLSKELSKEELITIPFMGGEIIVYRTMSGKVTVTDPFCPHLGAHFGYGGKVVNENLYCPFHAFEFDTTGQCVKTGYGTKPPPKAKLKIWPSAEVNGFIVTYYHQQNEPPNWEIPALETNSNWTPLIYKSYLLNDHPQEITENSVDIGHFPVTHKYKKVTALRKPIIENQFLSTKYSFVKENPPFINFILPKGQKIYIETNIYGLGYSQVNVKIPKLNLTLRMWVLPTPINAKKLKLRLVMSLQRREGIIGGIDFILSKLILEGFAKDTQQDFAIWENKIFLEAPALAEGDGPIGKYRKWARQFYTNI